MRSIPLLFVLLLTLRRNVEAFLIPEKYCFSGCELSIGYVSFSDAGPTSKKVESCQSILRATSLYLCIDEYCGDEGREKWLRGANETCQQIANTSMPPYDTIAAYGPPERAGLWRLSAEEAFERPVLGDVWLPDDTFLTRAFKTVVWLPVSALQSTDLLSRMPLLMSMQYIWCMRKCSPTIETDIVLNRGDSWTMLYFWAIVLILGMGRRFLFFTHCTRPKKWYQIPGLSNEAEPSGSFAMISMLWKRYITIPATFNNHCSQPIGWCTVPPRIQSLTIISFVALNIVLCTVDYRITDGNLYWPREYIQLWRYVSDRTGIISLANLPLVWVFGMRNNVLMWATGWGFGTYNTFHRRAARVSTVQAVVHSIGYTIMVCERRSVLIQGLR
jgi:hypothetical protein